MPFGGSRNTVKRSFGFWALISIGAVLNIMFIAGQTMSLIDHDLTVALGLQESVEELSEVGIAFARGFAFGDTVFYIPLFVIGMIGLLKRKSWGVFFMFGALAITVYWPAVHLFAIYSGRSSMNLSADKYVSYSVLLPLIIFYGLWGMWFLYKNRDCDEIVLR
jgi:hypothetical protein